MSKALNIHLFNCDRTYKLDAVEDWLNRTKAKLGFEFSVAEKHYFSLSEMSELSSKKIPGLQMDLAVFVVHAHESRLSINEENAGIGYAKIYRALLQATGENVIIVIGGDDNYKNEDEENKEFISRWAKRKVSSQFSEEFLDGRKSFIFSWNKKHREIHEEALVHFVKRKGQKFEYQPKRKLPQRPTTPPPARAAGPAQPLKLNRSLSERPSSGERVRSADTIAAGGNIASHIREPEIRPSKEVPPSGAGRVKSKDLAILGCNVAGKSMEVVKQIFDAIRLALSISTDTILENVSPLEAKSYLTENPPRFCVLVVDAATVQDAYQQLPKRRAEYDDLLRTAANKVVEKVIVMICGPCALPSPSDEVIVAETVGSILKSTGKGFVVWMEKIAEEPNVLLQMIIGQTSVIVNTQPQMSYPGLRPSKVASAVASVPTGIPCVQKPQESHMWSRPQQQTPDDPLRHGQNVNESQQAMPRQPTGTSSSTKSVPRKVGFVMLKTGLFKGKISYDQGHVEIFYPGFTVPDYITQSLYEKYSNTPQAVVQIKSDKSGQPWWTVAVKDKQSVNLAKNETVVLKTCVRFGQISMQEGDLEFLYPQWKAPDFIVERLKREYWATPVVELYVISDEKGNLRVKEQTAVKNKALDKVNKVKEGIKKPFR